MKPMMGHPVTRSADIEVLRGSGVPISNEAAIVYSTMGNGFILRVPHDGNTPQMIPRDGGGCGFSCDIKTVEELARIGLIHKLTEHGEPPPEQRKRGDSWRSGWRDKGLDGAIADWWVCTQ